MRLSSETVRISLRGVRGPRPRVRVRRRDRGEVATRAPRRVLVLVDRAARRGAQRGLEQRVHLRRREREVRHLVRARAGPVVAPHVRARRVVGLGPVEPRLRLGAPGAPPGVDALDAAEQDDVVLAAGDRGREPVDEHLRAVAADRRGDRGGGAPRRAGRGARPDPGTSTTAARRRRPCRRPRAATAAHRSPCRRRASASASRSIGSSARLGSATRCCVWPTPTMTGVRGSIGMARGAYRPSLAGLARGGFFGAGSSGPGGVGHVGTPGAAVSGQIER